jgi:hypothetical protein
VSLFASHNEPVSYEEVQRTREKNSRETALQSPAHGASRGLLNQGLVKPEGETVMRHPDNFA